MINLNSILNGLDKTKMNEVVETSTIGGYGETSGSNSNSKSSSSKSGSSKSNSSKSGSSKSGSGHNCYCYCG